MSLCVPIIDWAHVLVYNYYGGIVFRINLFFWKKITYLFVHPVNPHLLGD